jgi:hypothetical protein
VFAISVAIIISLIVGFALGSKKTRKGLIVELEEPLHLETGIESPGCTLPKGTVLYFDHSPRGESFDVYSIYLNVHGKPFELKAPEKPNLIAPLTAFRDM